MTLLPAGSPPLVVAFQRHQDPAPWVDRATGAISRRAHGPATCPADDAALEVALRVAQAWQGRVLIVTAGPPAADAALRDALAAASGTLAAAPSLANGTAPRADGHSRPRAAGVDGSAIMVGALRLDWRSDQTADLTGDDRALAAALAGYLPEPPALVMCGDGAPGRATGALAAFLAHELGAAQALGLVQVEPGSDCLLGHRRLPGGRRELLRVRPPAVCSVEAAGVRLRRASLPAVVAAREAVIPVVTPARPVSVVQAGPPRPFRPRTRVAPRVPSGTARERVLALTGVLTGRETASVSVPPAPAEAAEELLCYLNRAGVDTSGPGRATSGSEPA